MGRFVESIQAYNADVVGAGTLWTTADLAVGGKPPFGLFNRQYPVYGAADCPLCAAGVPSEASPY